MAMVPHALPGDDMPNIHCENADGFDVCVLSAGSYSCSTIPRLGMLTTSLTWDGMELLQTRTDPRTYAEHGTTTGIPFLYPWANRIGGLAYTYRKHHVTLDPATLPISIVSPGGAIHGIHHGYLPWEEGNVSLEGECVRVQTQLAFTSECSAFPAFPFQHRVLQECELSPEGLRLRTTIYAVGDQEVPITFGYHPYFKLPTTPRDEWILDIPVKEEFPLEDMVPCSSPLRCKSLSGQLGARTFDNSYLMPKTPLSLQSPTLRLQLDASDMFRALQIYAPPNSPFVCLEPMTAHPAPFSAPYMGLETALPGASRSACLGISCSAQ